MNEYACKNCVYYESDPCGEGACRRYMIGCKEDFFCADYWEVVEDDI